MARAPRATVRSRRREGRTARGSPRRASKGQGLMRIGIVDTSFSRYDTASAAIDELRKQGGGFLVERYTVPGIKDLAAGGSDALCPAGRATPALGRGGAAG